jgi:hypothetical protein
MTVWRSRLTSTSQRKHYDHAQHKQSSKFFNPLSNSIPTTQPMPAQRKGQALLNTQISLKVRSLLLPGVQDPSQSVLLHREQALYLSYTEHSTLWAINWLCRCSTVCVEATLHAHSILSRLHGPNHSTLCNTMQRSEHLILQPSPKAASANSHCK